MVVHFAPVKYLANTIWYNNIYYLNEAGDGRFQSNSNLDSNI